MAPSRPAAATGGAARHRRRLADCPAAAAASEAPSWPAPTEAPAPTGGVTGAETEGVTGTETGGVTETETGRVTETGGVTGATGGVRSPLSAGCPPGSGSRAARWCPSSAESSRRESPYRRGLDWTPGRLPRQRGEERTGPAGTGRPPAAVPRAGEALENRHSTVSAAGSTINTYILIIWKSTGYWWTKF